MAIFFTPTTLGASLLVTLFNLMISLLNLGVLITFLYFGREEQTFLPSISPSFYPSIYPTMVPSYSPSISPSDMPTNPPSIMDSTKPSTHPSLIPTFQPTQIPSMKPSQGPSQIPSFLPTQAPSLQPSLKPSLNPTTEPSKGPSSLPSFLPSIRPSHKPSITPTTIPSSIPTILNPRKILAPDGELFDNFGWSVDIYEELIAVGAYGDDDNGSKSGSAYIFATDGSFLHKLVPSDGATNEYFGYSVAISDSIVAVGAVRDDENGSDSGSAYIFTTNGEFVIKIIPIDGQESDFFGESVAISDGIIVVGAFESDDSGNGSGSAYLYLENGDFVTKIIAPDGVEWDYFGESVAISENTIVIGAFGDDDVGADSGSAYIFSSSGNFVAKITPNDGASGDYFGWSVAVFGDVVVVGAFRDDDKGTGSGSAYIYTSDGDFVTKLVAPDGVSGARFGRSVAVHGNRIIVGADRDRHNGSASGSVYIFSAQGEFLEKLIAPDGVSGDNFGVSVAAYGDKVIVGADGDDDNGDGSGSAYIHYF